MHAIRSWILSSLFYLNEAMETEEKRFYETTRYLQQQQVIINNNRKAFDPRRTLFTRNNIIIFILSLQLVFFVESPEYEFGIWPE